MSSDDVSSKAGGPLGLLVTCFSLREEVGRVTYAVVGFGLMLLKYATEAVVIWDFTGKFFSPLDFLAPTYSARAAFYVGAPDWLGWAQLVWSLPFLWIAVSLSVRRAANAGYSPWTGLLVMVPVVNLAYMLLMCIVPPSPRRHWVEREAAQADAEHGIRSAMLGVAASVVLALAMVGGSVYLLDSYGGSLFIATPFVMGALSSWIYNRRQSHSVGKSMGIAALSTLLAGLTMLLFALEGVVCLIIAAPLALPLAVLGGLLGKAIADCSARPPREVLAGLLVLPLGAGLEAGRPPRPPVEHVVLTSIEIDAPPDIVWRHVIDFPPIEAAPAWYFRAGIACPLAAEISGQGVGAVRRCRFTTGDFIEPITVWDEPRRLAFDVESQPDPMEELSPYGHLHPPHLDWALVSRRGEFRLVELPGGRTRLEGRTWYTLQMQPQAYWKLWTDALLHRIHGRVLDHVGRRAENASR